MSITARNNKVKVILNPYSGNLPEQVKVAKVEQALRQTGLDYHLEITARRGHGIELARQAACAGWPIIVAVGGDGTINEVVNGLMQAAGETEVGTLGIIPLGTGNDLAEVLQIPLDVTAACRRLADGRTRLIDVGQVNNRYFVNNSAIGIESVITMALEELHWLPGRSRYILATLRTVMSVRFWPIHLSWENNTYDGAATLVSVGNGYRTGGSFYMTPHARVDDGQLDFVYMRKLSRWEILQLLPLTLKGTHIHRPQVAYHRTTALSITTLSPIPIQADGEIIAEDATEIIYKILPGKLRVIV